MVAKATNGEGMKQLATRLKGLGKQQLQVGWFPGMTEPNGTPTAYVAAIQEFGGSNGKGATIPPRPTIRPTMIAQKTKWAKTVSVSAKRALESGDGAKIVAETLGLVAVGDIKTAISELTAPALAEATIKRRTQRYSDKGTVGSLDKPLVDSSRMLSTLTHLVTEK